MQFYFYFFFNMNWTVESNFFKFVTASGKVGINSVHRFHRINNFSYVQLQFTAVLLVPLAPKYLYLISVFLRM